MPSYPRIGHGYDSHRFCANRPLILGGVTIPFARGLDGHSDADALTHALMDAILGALALGDIGQHFPDSSPQWKGISSLLLLEQVVSWMFAAGFEIGHVDATIITEQPKLAPHIPALRARLAEVLQCPLSAVSVKAKTNEHMDDVGLGKGLVVHSVALLVPRTQQGGAP